MGRHMALRVSNVSMDGWPFGEISVVDLLERAIYLGCKDALMSESLKCETESA